MPLLLLSLLISMFSNFSSRHVSEELETSILIRNIRSTQGVFVISFYDDEKAFPKVGKELLTEKVEVKDTFPHTLHIKVPKEGWYAIAMFQDEDRNGKIKQDKVGIPEEPYAFSNNIHPKVAAPTFAMCKFYAGREASKPIEIRLIQPRFHGRL
jgi:uncharacterized protein (DUF2141 family)